MSKREKNLVVVAAIMIVLLLAVGGTYAYWTTTQVQSDDNEINTTCLEVELLNKTKDETQTTEGITLEKAFPVSDADGLKDEGYTFTIKNKCDKEIYYDVNLESLNISSYGNYSSTTSEEESQYLQSKYIKVAIDPDSTKEQTYKKLDEYTNSSQSFLDKDSSITSYEHKNLLNKQQLGANDSVSHTLKMWVDENAPMTQMEKHYQGKIVIYSWLGDSNPYPVN